jgi:hypothetical protein
MGNVTQTEMILLVSHCPMWQGQVQYYIPRVAVASHSAKKLKKKKSLKKSFWLNGVLPF